MMMTNSKAFSTDADNGGDAEADDVDLASDDDRMLVMLS